MKYMPPESRRSLKRKADAGAPARRRPMRPPKPAQVQALTTGAPPPGRPGSSARNHQWQRNSAYSPSSRVRLSLAQAFFGIDRRLSRQWRLDGGRAPGGDGTFVSSHGVLLPRVLLREQRLLRGVTWRTTRTRTAAVLPGGGLWGAHEGSLLLWISILAIWSLAVAAFSRQLPITFSSRVLGIMGLISGGFSCSPCGPRTPFFRCMPASATAPI